MIRALREQHRRTFLLLAATLPLCFLGLLLTRPPLPHELPPLSADRGGRHPIGVPLTLGSPRMTAQLLADPGSSVPNAVEVTPDEECDIPDQLLYWAPGGGTGGALPPDAVLIGALGDSRQELLPFPEPGRMSGGHFLLYSGVRHEILADAPLPAAP